MFMVPKVSSILDQGSSWAEKKQLSTLGRSAK